MDTIAKVKAFIKRHNLVRPGNLVLVAVSGGPDSVSLLYVLNRLRVDLGIRLRVAHVDHNLRKDSVRDKKFVQALAERIGIPFDAGSVRIKKRKGTSSIEELAREARIQFLTDCAQKRKATAVALGHTQDDLAETVLMRILRGTGLLGLKAMEPQRMIAGTKFVRPFLEISRQEIESLIKREHLKYRMDKSNFSDRFFRNKIRRRLLPTLIKDYNPNIKQTLVNFARTVGADYDFLENFARKNLAGVRTRSSKGTTTIAVDKFLKLPQSVRRVILRLIIQDLAGDLRRIGFTHIEQVEQRLHPGRTFTIQLPGAIIVTQDSRNQLIIRRKFLNK